MECLESVRFLHDWCDTSFAQLERTLKASVKSVSTKLCSDLLKGDVRS